MAAFVIADTKIENAEAYEDYKKKARAIAESYGGRYRARGGEHRVVAARRPGAVLLAVDGHRAGRAQLRRDRPRP